MDDFVVFGVGGQDGSFLAEELLQRGKRVYGVRRRSSSGNTDRLQPWVCEHPKFSLHTCDITDIMAVYRLLEDIEPDCIFNLAAQSHVGTSFNECLSAIDVTFKGCANILECVRELCPYARFYQASSSEMFGNSFSYDNSGQRYQNEYTPFKPCSPYAVNKLAAHNLVAVYRESYGCWASSGILFNHESERRGREFVTRKITRYLGHLHNHLRGGDSRFGPMPKLRLGNIDSCRDWGYAPEYVTAMVMMMTHNNDPKDYVVSTGQTFTIREFLDQAFKLADLNYQDWVVTDDAEFNRPNDVVYLKGDSSLIRQELGWKPNYTMQRIAEVMFEKDYLDLKKNGPDSAPKTN